MAIRKNEAMGFADAVLAGGRRTAGLLEQLESRPRLLSDRALQGTAGAHAWPCRSGKADTARRPHPPLGRREGGQFSASRENEDIGRGTRPQVGLPGSGRFL